MENLRRLKRLSAVMAGAIIIVILAVLLRGPHVSNALKRIILPELEAATGQKVIVQKIYINLFPLFAEAKDLKVFDESGRKLLLVNRVKAYISLSGLMSKTVTIQRLVIKGPVVQADEEQMRAIQKSIQEYLAKKREDAISVKVKAIEVQEGSLDFRSEESKMSLSVNGLQGEAIIGDAQRIRAEVKEVKVLREGLPEITAGASAQVVLKGDTVTIRKAEIDALGSRISGSGEYAQGQAMITAAGDILVATFKKLFGLEKSGEGRIKVSGTIQYAKENTTLDLSLGGNFYLETLMELLRVKERLEGLVEFKGDIKGPVREIRAQGTATLKKGNLYNVLIDSLACKVLYEKGTLRFVDGDGSLYRGRAKASASLTLPEVDHYSLNIAFTGADSKPLFKLIGWDPGIPEGKVNGTLHHEGAEFNPKGDFEYVSVQTGKDLLGRVKGMTGTYDLEGDLLTLTDLRMKTGLTAIVAGGTIDIKKETLDLQGMLKTPEVTDLTLPYYRGLKGECGYAGKIQGTFQDPIIIGKATIGKAVIEGYPAGTVTGDFSYRKDLLQIKEIRADSQTGTQLLTGNISFKGAKELFDLSHPLYNLKATIRHADIERFVKIFYADFVGTGTFTSSLTIEGSGQSPDIHADVSLDNAVIYTVPADSASFDFTYAQSHLEFRRVSVKRGESLITGNATIYSDNTFSYKATSDKIRLSDIIQRPLQGEVVLSLLSEGRGSFDNPSIAIDARMTEGTLRGKPVGKGVITASLQGKEFNANAKIINDKISVTAKGRTDGVIPWEATVDIQTGRYDFLITSLLKDVPEDLILSLNGNVHLRGSRSSMEGSAAIKNMVLSLYQHTFTNEEEIRFDLKDRELSLGRIALRSGNTLLRAGGTVAIGKNYNVTIEGSSALSPFKSLSAKLGVLRGDAEFVVGITGDWNNPKINGGITLDNGAIGLKEYPAYRITNLKGYLYMDNDRVVLESLNGKLGGGDIGLSGILYLKKFAFSRFYVEAKLNNITTSVSNEFTINFGGNILYKGTPQSQMVSGNIDINKSRYRERVEWKSWLLQTKKVEKYKSEISNLEKAELNIKITGKDNIVIDNNVARAVVSADMVLRGTIYRPLLFGRIETREGTVFFRNNEFNILHASADFADPKRLNPFVSIAAETIVKSYKIKMNLEGQMDHFNMSLSSDPPLKEMDVLTLLTVGQRGDELKGLEGGIGASEATSFVTGKLQDVVEERVRSITGLDRIQIDPHVSKKTATVEPRVTVSKRLLSDKLYLTYSSPVSSREEQIVKIEYYMGKNISLIGIRDERGIIGGDIRFRFEFK